MRNILRKIAFVAIMALTAVGCQKENLEEQAINAEAQKPELPAEIHITSATQLPEGEILTARLASANVTAYDVQGTYNGLLHDVVMNGKAKDTVPNIPIKITAQRNNKFNLYMPPFRVGKMPGHLSVDIQGLTLKSDGTFYADTQHDKSKLKKTVILNMLIDYKYDTTLVDGSFTPVDGGYKLKLTLESKGSIWFIEIFRAHVKYDGKKQ